MNMDGKKNIMIIGAAGSLGSVLCKILIESGEYDIFAVDFNENNLAYLYRLYNICTYIEDLKNIGNLINIIENNNIDLVVNCAALKHVKWCDNNIGHAIETNIVANLNLMKYLNKVNKKFIYISSDKATDPTNLYALTKQFTDYIVHYYKFKLIRGVNFFNSRGSVIDIWEQQYLHHKPFTVSIDSCKRYFILISTMANIVKRAIDEDSVWDKEYCPDKVLGIDIKCLFEAFLQYKGLNEGDYEVSWFSIPSNEKLCETLDFNPEIVELNNIDDIVKLIKSNGRII
jgi:FlaA1/EpsC-like NDP-sugar epimerase